ncbi:hypothetical protein SAMN05443572_105400 [Myxococcus fulvus]|uniref:Uncharacterized protein n=2 Tax=Myxococcus fulvus TaxID=33 RepID=A0A511T4R9_MYXFU|nr:hypothetical protein MFU01_41820 [Myxococcus fulvus]SEU15835.1 hypothetical protein SAMN05443572_105400 [Myxococcus fulvus]
MTNPEWLERAARRGRSEPWSMAYTFEQYRQIEGINEDTLAEELGCTQETLHWMSLCRRPEGDSFSEQCTAIAQKFGVDRLMLMQVIRHVDVINAFSKGTRSESTTTLRMAAQDHLPDEETDT